MTTKVLFVLGAIIGASIGFPLGYHAVRAIARCIQGPTYLEPLIKVTPENIVVEVIPETIYEKEITE